VDERRRRGGILGGPVDGPARLRAAYPTVEAVRGTRATHRSSRFLGRVVRLEGDFVVLRNGTGTERHFSMVPGAFSVDGDTVTLIRPARRAAPAPPGRTASGSVAVPRAPARVARGSRILVEGIHDAELVEKVWGDDLRLEGVVVERLDGVDHLPDVVRSFAPGPGRRLGVLVDHLVAGSKEARTAAEVSGPHVLVTGTPYVDVWEAVRPRLLGLAAWPEVPRGRPWKEGVCEVLGEPEPGRLWRRILGTVTSYADLEPPLVGAVERLIDFVTEPG
jgi:hypothetical protein